MTRLSSNWTFFYKRIFPILFIGPLILFSVVLLLIAARSGSSPQLPFIIVPIVIGVIFYFTMKKLVFDLADEVVDLGDALLVKNGNQEDRNALSATINFN
jgi:lipopolysaccharide export LptBFGC system permease protein LptF